MTIRDSLYFEYAGKKSADFGILNVNVNSNGLLEEPFGSEIELKEVKIRGNDKPYYQGKQRQPLKFSVSFAFEDKWNEQKIREIVRWLLGHEYYQPLIFSNDPERIYYCLVIDEPILLHNGLSEGFVNLNFRCDSPYIYSPQKIINYDWNEVPLEFNDTNMTQGEIHNLITDSENNLIIDSNKTKWSDLPSDMTWRVLLEL